MFTMSLSGVLFLFLLHHSTLDGVDGQVNSNTLARIINFFERNYRNDGQYAVAINVEREMCRGEFNPLQNNFLTNENATVVKSVIANEQSPVYEGTELIAAGLKNEKNYKLHSEYLLLNLSGYYNITPMQYLLNRRRNGCTIFYTLNSPCMNTCLKERYSIIPGVKKFKKYQGLKAFVFKNIWTRDQGEDKKEKLRQNLKTIADLVPLWRCRNNACILCGEPNSIDIRRIREECLTV